MILPLGPAQTLDDTVEAMLDNQARAKQHHAEQQAYWRRMMKQNQKGSHECSGSFAGKCGRPISNNAARCWDCACREANRVEPADRWMENAA